jgi:hypothetical protein
VLKAHSHPDDRYVMVLRRTSYHGIGEKFDESKLEARPAAVFSDTNIRRERQLEGIARAKANNVYKGRPKSIDVGLVQRMHADGKRPTDIAKELGIGRASVYRALDAHVLATPRSSVRDAAAWSRSPPRPRLRSRPNWAPSAGR